MHLPVESPKYVITFHRLDQEQPEQVENDNNVISAKAFGFEVESYFLAFHRKMQYHRSSVCFFCQITAQVHKIYNVLEGHICIDGKV